MGVTCGSSQSSSLWCTRQQGRVAGGRGGFVDDSRSPGPQRGQKGARPSPKRVRPPGPPVGPRAKICVPGASGSSTRPCTPIHQTSGSQSILDPSPGAQPSLCCKRRVQQVPWVTMRILIDKEQEFGFKCDLYITFIDPKALFSNANQ